MGERVRFELCDASNGAAAMPANPPYDLVLAIEMLHDVPDPVGVLTTMRERRATAARRRRRRACGRRVHCARRRDGTVQAAESVLDCLPVGMVEPGPAVTGTVIRSGIVRAYATRAGFAHTEILPVDHPQFRLYRLGEV